MDISLAISLNLCEIASPPKNTIGGSQRHGQTISVVCQHRPDLESRGYFYEAAFGG
jgi:hypothetical protein